MVGCVCPLWCGYLLASPVRRWILGNPESLLKPYVQAGMTVLEPGPGMGFFTLPLAQMVGPTGRVIAADIQPKMLDELERRAYEAGLQDRIELREVAPDHATAPEWEGTIDFALAFAVVHETPSADAFFMDLAAALKHKGVVLFAEPSGHVGKKKFQKELDAARYAGFVIVGEPHIFRTRAAVLRKV